MKRQLLFFILLTVLNFIAIAQNVTIPDVNFKAYLVGNSSVNTNGDSEIQVSEASAFMGSINCSNNGISDLTGIESFVNITGLICNTNNLSSLNVSQNIALTVLNCQANNLTSLDVSQNTALTGLNCAQNSLSALILNQNTALQELYCYENNLSALDVSQLTEIVSFNCSQNSIEILDFSQNTGINQNTGLTIPFINCQQNNLTVLKMQNISATSLQGQYFNATSNPNLTCIEVDDVASATANWTNIDATASYSTNCNPLAVGDTFVDNFITYVVTSISPNEVETIGYNTNGGTDVDIPATVSNNGTVYDVTSIGDYTFLGMNLTNVIIPDSVTAIGLYAFFINSLTSVTIPSGITVIEQGAFEDNSLTSVIIPNGVTVIGISAFKSNSLTNIIIPSNVTSIGLQAFTNNPLVNVTSENGMPPTITTSGSDDSFSSNRSGIDLTIPTATTGAYVTDPGALWTGFNSVTEDASLSISDFELANDISILNTKDGLKIISNGLAVLKNYTIYSISGAKIKEGTNSTIATGGISNGIYILKLDFDKGTVVKKVVVN